MLGQIGQIGREQEAQCVWCRETKAGLTADFPDGLKGFLCWKDFRNAVKVRSNGKHERPEGTKVRESERTREKS